jgi:hypothetical protein
MTTYSDIAIYFKTPILKLNFKKLNFYEKSKNINRNRLKINKTYFWLFRWYKNGTKRIWFYQKRMKT